MVRIFSALFVVLLAFSPTVSLAQERWVKAATQVVDLSRDAASITFATPFDAKAVRLQSADGAIRLAAVVINHGKGLVRAEERPIELRRGERTRPIEFTETARYISVVDLVLEPGQGPGQATLEVWVLTAQQIAAAPPTPAPPRPVAHQPSPAQQPAPAQPTPSEPSWKPTSRPYPTTRGISGPPAQPSGAASEQSSRDSGGAGGGGGAAGGGYARYSLNLPDLDACVKAKTCTAVPVFFGTDRNQTSVQDRVSFGQERAGRLQLGRVYVTVPRTNREPGELNLPSSWSSWLPWSPGLDATRHFTIPKSGIAVFATEDDFIAAVKEHIASGRGSFKDHAFVYVHGYRVPWEFAAMRTAQIAYDLAPNDAPFGSAFFYSWPSSGAAADYQYDVDSSRLAIPHLKRFLRLVAERTGASHIHVIAHSMGNFPLVHALDQISAEAPGVKFNQIVLAAPDVDKGEFEAIAAGVAKTAKGITLYASSSDYALMLSRLGRRNTPRAGDVKQPPGPALATGVDTVDISRLSTGFFSWFSWNHDKYADSPVLLKDIATLFQKGERPPSQRNGSFRPEPPQADPAKYWRYNE